MLGNYLLLKETSKQKFQDKEVESETLCPIIRWLTELISRSPLKCAKPVKATGQMVTVENIEVNPAVDDSIFKMPVKASK
jgi:hypothetical protein